MKTYLAPDNSLHCLSEEDIQKGALSLIPVGCVEISDEQAEQVRIANAVQIVPDRVTMRQARLALLNAGLLDAVNSAIASMPGIQGEAARIEWDYSNEVLRTKPLTIQLAQLIGMTPQEMDALFIEANTL